MALDKIPNTQLFTQRDVRETPASTATATAVGLTGEPYVLVSAGGTDLTAERVLTAGTGITLNDGGAGTTITATTNDSAIVHDNLSGFIANEHINWTIDQGATNIHTGNYTDTNTTYTAGEGLDLAGGVFSGENATTSNKGIASFNTNDFTVSSGAVSLKNKTSYASISAQAFREKEEGYGYIMHVDKSRMQNGADGGNYLMANIQLPHGAIVTNAIVYGSDASNTWILYRCDFAATIGTSMANANINSADSSINSATIDNSSYCYMISINIGTVDSVYGAKVTYTTDYD